MKVLLIGFSILFLSGAASAQGYEVVFDEQHFESVLANAATRSAAESAHDEYLGKIGNNITDLNTNVGSVLTAQTMIYQALSNVNSALKDGLEVKNMTVIISDMTVYISQALALAKDDPGLLLVANNIVGQMRARALTLVSDVSGFVLKEGSNVLADYNARDQLLHRVIQQLQILDGLAYGAWKAMYWAKERGIFASLNPFEAFINHDKAYASQILSSAKYLK